MQVFLLTVVYKNINGILPRWGRNFTDFIRAANSVLLFALLKFCMQCDIRVWYLEVVVNKRASLAHLQEHELIVLKTTGICNLACFSF